MPVGPIQLIAIHFAGFQPTGKLLPALKAAAKTGAIRLIDLQFVGKDADGEITSMAMSGLSPDEKIEFGAVIGGLLGAGMGGEQGAVEGAITGALAAAERSYGMTPGDIQHIADGLEPGDAAALLLIEHRWAVGFRDAAREAGGSMLAQGFLTPQAVFLVGAELQAQVNALDAIALSTAVQEEAAAEAIEALVLAEIAKDEAAETVAVAEAVEAAAVTRMLRTLASARIIEEAAMERAFAALDEAGMVKKEGGEGVTDPPA
jgi:uncharacterized membrane protein